MLYLTLMFIGVVLMLSTGALSSFNETLIPALSEMWGDSKLDVLLFTLIGHDDVADSVEARLEYAAFDAKEPERNAQWAYDLLVAVESTTPRVIGVTVGQFLTGSVYDNSDDLRAHSAPLLGEIEAPTAVQVAAPAWTQDADKFDEHVRQEAARRDIPAWLVPVAKFLVLMSVPRERRPRRRRSPARL